MKTTCFLAALFGAAAAHGARAQTPAIPVISTFDDSTDGWVVSDVATSWSAAGGNSGGFLIGQGNQDEDPPRVFPPASYLGDWTTLTGRAQLRYDHRVIYPGNGFCSGGHTPYTVTLSGPGGVAIWHGAYPPVGITDWVRIIVPVDPMYWDIESGDWPGLMADVSDINIAMEMFCNLNPPDDQCGLDNIALEWTCPADLAPPFGLLDLADVTTFVTGFVGLDPIADLNADGLFDLADVNLFVSSFLGGCP
ncbi:MAG: hypothetical protein H6810_04940 [Phycisphaeraceae bacterium]|nr:MAG: hypothetical protein H6810_04940 [Phycisphaeraceae bacterium]